MDEGPRLADDEGRSEGFHDRTWTDGERDGLDGKQVRTAIKRMCDACRIVRRRSRLFVVCEKTPKHKQRQGASASAESVASAGDGMEVNVGFAATGKGLDVSVHEKTCCEETRELSGAMGRAPRGMTLTGNYSARATATTSLRPRAAQGF